MSVALTIFYDGGCPLCVAEMRHLQKLNTAGNIAFENIYEKDFSERFPHINQQQADRILHGQTSDGSMLYGLDVTYRAWVLVGKRRWVAVLRWPLIKWFADIGYLFFARYRYTISGLLTGQSRCDSCNIDRR
ncbi:MAG: thiol-disulfide oxidoreductase DCC family protein [Porticoccaceae bacterium]